MLVKEQAPHLTTKKITLMGPVQNTSSSGATVFHNHPVASLSDAQSKLPNNELIKNRIELESFLLVPRTPLARLYIVDRILNMAKESDLGSFVYDGGFESDGKSWTSDLPSDAEIVFHLFCAYMDQKMRCLGVYKDTLPFTHNFITSADVKPHTGGSLCRICVVNRYPLRLCLSVGSQLWDVYEGRSNLFHTIALFVKYHEKFSAGYVDTLYLDGTVGLLNAVKSA
eukprot:Partr_v1_DN27077_c0_g1_i1_m29191 putative Transmembrane protein 209